MRIKNWDQFQHYKTGKNAAKRPEWIKLYTRLLDDIEFDELDGKDAKALVKLWALASEMEGELPAIKTIAFRLRLSEKETISILGRLGHWVDNVPRTEEEREEEENKNKKENKKRANAPEGDPLEALLGKQLASEVTEHRNRLRKPMTLKARQGLANQLSLVADPISAAELMISQGWQGFRPEYLQGRGAGPPQKSATRQGFERAFERARRHDTAVNSPGNVVTFPENRGGGAEVYSAPCDVERGE